MGPMTSLKLPTMEAFIPNLQLLMPLKGWISVCSSFFSITNPYNAIPPNVVFLLSSAESLPFCECFCRGHFSCSTSSPFGVVSALDFVHSNRWVAVAHFCFNLPFSDDIWYKTSFYMLHFFNCKISVKHFEGKTALSFLCSIKNFK